MLSSNNNFGLLPKGALNDGFGVDIEFLQEGAGWVEFDVVVVGNFEA